MNILKIAVRLLVILCVLEVFLFALASMNVRARCLALGAPRSALSWDGHAYCIGVVGGNEIAIPLDLLERRAGEKGL